MAHNKHTLHSLYLYRPKRFPKSPKWWKVDRFPAFCNIFIPSKLGGFTMVCLYIWSDQIGTRLIPNGCVQFCVLYF